MRYCVVVACYLFVQSVSAQRFWLTTPGFPMGSKTCLAGVQDTVLLIGVYEKGIWKTANGGYTWRNTMPGHSSVYALRVTSSHLIVAGGAGKIYYSRTLGESWDSVQLDTPYPIVEIMEDHRGGLYALTRYEDGDVLPTGDGVFYADGNVREWKKRNEGLPAHAACDHLAIDRNGRLYLATTDIETTGRQSLFVSGDDGASWVHRPLTVKGKTDPSAYAVRPQFNYSLTITAQDSIMYSFTGLGANFGVTLNVIKHIDDIDKDSPWKITNSGGWSNVAHTPIHIARNGDYYSAVDGTQTGGTLVSKDRGQSWTSHREGLGVTKSGFTTRQVFYETSYGLIYMIRYLDDLVYWTDESVVNARRITGRVTDGQAAAKMAEFSFAGQRLYRTDLDGYYVILAPAGWSGTIKPYQRTHTFEPARLEVDDIQEDVVQDFKVSYAQVTYLLSGKVTAADGMPMAHIPLVGLPEYMETAADGTFAIAVPAGWQGSVTPRALQHAFSPATYHVPQLAADREMNFTASKRNSFHLQGTIRDAAQQPIAGVTLTGPGGPVSTDAQGHFYIAAEAGWTGTLTPAKAGYTFVPARMHIMPLAMDIDALSMTGKFDVTGVEETDNVIIRPYPNPTDGDVHIDLPQPNNGLRLDVYTLTGQPVLTEQVNEPTSSHRFRLTQAGMYVVKVRVGQKLHTARLVVW